MQRLRVDGYAGDSAGKREEVQRVCVDGYAGDSAGKRERTGRHPYLK